MGKQFQGVLEAFLPSDIPGSLETILVKNVSSGEKGSGTDSRSQWSHAEAPKLEL